MVRVGSANAEDGYPARVNRRPSFLHEIIRVDPFDFVKCQWRDARAVVDHKFRQPLSVDENVDPIIET